METRLASGVTNRWTLLLTFVKGNRSHLLSLCKISSSRLLTLCEGSRHEGCNAACHSCDRGIHNRGVFPRTLAQHGVLIRQC